MNVIREAAQFLVDMRKKLRRGEVMREPLTTLRFEWRGDTVECDWLIRPVDPADRKEPGRYAQEQQAQQAFRDAFSMRSLIFESFPAVMQANLRMFRGNHNHQLELLMAGKVNRLAESFEKVTPLAERARRIGFEFVLVDGVFSGPIDHKSDGLKQVDR